MGYTLRAWDPRSLQSTLLMVPCISRRYGTMAEALLLIDRSVDRKKIKKIHFIA